MHFLQRRNGKLLTLAALDTEANPYYLASRNNLRFSTHLAHNHR